MTHFQSVRAWALLLCLLGVLDVDSAGRLVAAANTTAPVVTSTAPTTTAPAVDATNLIDIRLNAWADELTTDYLNAISRVAKVPVSRLQIQSYGGVPAVEFGTQYVLSIVVLSPTNRSGDTADAATAAEAIEAAINNAVGVDKFFIYGAIAGAKRVIPAARASVAASLSVSYVWVAFLLLGVFMTGVVCAILIRRRSRSSEDKINAFDEETRRNIPRDTSNDNARALLKMVHSAKTAEREKLRQERDQLRFAPTAKLFVAALHTDHRLQLPPVSTAPDPLANTAKDYEVAKRIELGSAATRAVSALHREIDEKVLGHQDAEVVVNADDAAAAASATHSGTSSPRPKTLREMHNQVRLLDDADL